MKHLLLGLLILATMGACAHNVYQEGGSSDTVIVRQDVLEDNIHGGNLDWTPLQREANEACNRKGYRVAVGTDEYEDSCKFYTGRAGDCRVYEFTRLYRCKGER